MESDFVWMGLILRVNQNRKRNQRKDSGHLIDFSRSEAEKIELGKYI